MSNIREQLASIEHEQWIEWMEYLFKKTIENSDGSVVIPAALVNRWKRQMRTPYANLSEEEKESDRAIADKVIQVLNTYNPSK